MRFGLLCTVALIGFAIGLATTSSAAPNHWIGDTVNRTPPSATPSGTWNTATANWSGQPDGLGTPVNWVANDIAIFSGGGDATGTYTVTVSSTQTASGITVEEGNPTFSGGTLSLNNGTIIDIASGSTTTIASTMTTVNPNTVTKSGTGTLILTGTNTSFAGEFILNSGTVGVGNNSAFGATAGNSKLTINGGNLSDNSATARTVSANLQVFLDGDFSADASLANGLINFAGVTTIRNSNRTITVNGAGHSTSGSSLQGLSFQNLQDAGGNRSITKQGTGNLRFEISMANAPSAFTGDIFVQQGWIEVSSSGRIGTGGNTIHFDGGSLNSTTDRTASSDPIANPIVITQPTMITTASTSATVNMNFTGSITATAGSITFRNEGADAGIDTFEPRFTQTSDLTLGIPITIDNGTIGLTRFSSFNGPGTTQTFNGIISGNGSYRRSISTGAGGTTEFTAANTYSGGTAVNGGTLVLSNTTGSGTGGGLITINTGGTLAGTGGAAGNVTINGGATNGGILTGTLNIGGTVTVNSGGIVTPGTAGVGTLALGGLTLNAGTTPAPNSILNFELDTLAASDRINVTTSDLLTINAATVNITALGGFGAGTYTLIDYAGTVQGDGVTGLSTGVVPGSFTYEFIDDVPNSLIKLKVTAPGSGVDGDYNGNDVVDAADYVLWRNGGPLQHDPTLGVQDPDDYDFWRAHFGETFPGSGAGLGESAAVPEPATAVLLLFGVLALGLRRRAV